MALTTGSPLPDVKTTTAQTTTAPTYYTDYLSNLAKAGQTATGMEPSQMVAGFDQLQTTGFSNLPTAADAYKNQLAAAGTTAADVAGGVTPGEIDAFMNPYTRSVVDEMARLSQQNVQRNVLPALKGMFTSTGGMGSQRMMNATGQTLADIQAGLTGQQASALQKGYSDAVTAALQQEQLQNMAAQTQGALAEEEQRLGLTGAKSLLDAGAIKQAYEQAKIEAPLKMASNAAALLRGYQIPLNTTQTFTGPMPGAYGASPLQTIVGLGSLFASGTGGTSAASGIGSSLKGAYDWLKANWPSAASGISQSELNSLTDWANSQSGYGSSDYMGP